MTDTKINSDNARSMHFLMGPIRLLEGLMKTLGWIAIFMMLACFNTCGWIFGVGSNGQGERVDAATKANNSGVTFNVDFAHSSKDSGGITRKVSSAITERDLTEGGTFRNHYGNNYENISWDANLYKQDISTRCDADSTVRPDALALRDFNPWSRSQTSFRRKTARLERAYIVGALSASRLRTTLARIKEYGHSHRNTVKLYDPLEQTDCDDLDNSLLTRLDSHTPGIESIQLLHAPVLAIHYAEVPFSGTHLYQTSFRGNDAYQGIIGMRVVDSINEVWVSAYYTTTEYADLFWTTIPAYQEEAESALLNMATDEFWIQAAHDNQIFGHDDQIKEAAQYSRDIPARFFKGFESGATVNRTINWSHYVGLN